MKIGVAYYELKSPELRAVVAEAIKERGKVRGIWAKFAKKVGANPDKFLISNERLMGLLFKKEPDFDLWREGQQRSWAPRGNTNRKLYAEFKALPHWDTKKLEAAVKWKDIHDNYHFYFFNWFHYENSFSGITLPVFDADDYKKRPELSYKPLKGMKEISWKTHNKNSAMTKKEYLLTLPQPSVRSSGKASRTSISATKSRSLGRSKSSPSTRSSARA